MTTRYASVTEFRNETNIQSGEYSDAQLEQLLDIATEQIDFRTGRTWQGIQTVTDEYYDGNGETFLYLNHPDVTSIDALAINENFDGNYTSVTLDYVRLYGDIGRIELDVENSDSTNIEVDTFTKGPKTVKVSYQWGNSAPTDEVKQLCILMVEERISSTPEKIEEIKRRINSLRFFDIEDV